MTFLAGKADAFSLEASPLLLISPLCTAAQILEWATFALLRMPLGAFIVYCLDARSNLATELAVAVSSLS